MKCFKYDCFKRHNCHQCFDTYWIFASFRTIIPRSHYTSKVFDELSELSRFGVDISPITQANWLKISSPKQTPLLSHLLDILDEGEAHAIALAIELKSDLLIIDEYEGRKMATQLKLQITGVGGILVRAKLRSFIPSVKLLLDLMRSNANFYLSEKVYSEILRQANELS